MDEADEALSDAYCSTCEALVVEPTTAHARGACASCGRHVYRLPTDEGLRVEHGEDFVLPAGSIRLSLDHQQGTGRLFRPGFTWLVERFFLDSAPAEAEGMADSLEKYEAEANEVLKASAILADLDLETQAGGEVAVERIREQRDTPEFWAMCLGAFVTVAKQAISASDTLRAAWAVSRIETARSMLIYLRLLEPLAWRGYNVAGYDQLKQLAQEWQKERNNSSEEFWQRVFTENVSVLGQALHVPTVIYQGKAYLGGKNVANQGGKYVDFLLRNPVSRMAAVVEIKTPMSPLLASTEYRAGVHNPSKELNGSVLQVLSYRETITREYHTIRSNDPDWEAADPPCVVIIGDAARELDNKSKRESFELFRRNLRNVDIITFDEIFGRFEQLLAAVSSFQ